MAFDKRTKKDESMDPASQKMKQYVLAGVAVGLIAFAIFMFTRGSGSSAPPIPRSNAMNQNTNNMPGPMGPGMGMPTPAGEKKTEQEKVTIPAIQLPEMATAERALVGAAQEYLIQYDQAVSKGTMADLAKWAYEHELYVEALYAGALAEQPVELPQKLHDTRFLVTDSVTQAWKMMSQMEFEKSLPANNSSKMNLARKAAARLGQMKDVGSISSQSELANLLVQADTPRGRELYQKNIKEKGFYRLLVRAMERAYLNDVTPETAWQTSWLHPVPINLWLIEQMIDLDPAIFTSKENVDTKNETKGPGPMPGMMGPMGPGMGPAPNAKPLPGLAHRLMLLEILTRRGGLVSAQLISKLMEKDKDQTLFNGLIQGQVNGTLFTRFTGVYADPLVDSFAKDFAKFTGQQSEWLTIAGILARMNNDRAASLVFMSAGNNMILSKDLVFSLAAGGKRSVIKNLGIFVKASRIQDVDVNNLFLLWTEPVPGAGKSLWRVVGQLVPDLKIADNDQQNSFPMENDTAGPAGMPGGPFPPGPMPPGAMPGMNPGMAPGPGMMPGMPMGPMGPMRMASSSGQEAPRTFGWPTERKFAEGVSAKAALAFLKALSRFKTDASDAKALKSPPPGPGMYGPGFGSMNVTAIDGAGKARIKREAMQCLVTLDNPKLAKYFNTMIDDPVAGDYARLGLCILDDQESCAALLTYFWKHPLELDPLPANVQGNQGGAAKSVSVSAGRIGVPLNPAGLPQTGVSAREALIYFDYNKGSEAFMASLGAFLTHKDAYDSPDRVADAACSLIDTIGRWAPPNAPSTLADLIESTSDFGLRDANRSADANQNPLPTKVRMQALAVLGKIGDQESMNVILRIATYSRPDELLGIAAKIALAKRGIDEAAGIFLDMLDPAIKSKTENAQAAIADQLTKIDPSFKTSDDIALLGLSRVKLNDMQVERAIGLIKTLGKGDNIGSGPIPLQQRLVLSLLEGGQGTVLTKLAQIVGQIPAVKKDQDSSQNDPYYWNRVDNAERDKRFLEMIQALSKRETYEDEKAVVTFVTAILRREEAVLVSNRDQLEQWDPLRYIIQFDKQSFSFGGGIMDMAAFGPGNLPGSNAQSNTNSADRYKLDLRFPQISDQNSGQTTQQAAIEGLKLVGQLKNAVDYFRGMRELNYFRYLADFMLWQDGNSDGGEELARLLAESCQTKQATYLKFLAIEQLQRSENPKLLALFAGVLGQTSDLITRAKIGDAAMYVAAETWRERMMGKNFILNNPKQIGEIADAWQPLLEGKKYDWTLANRIMVAIAPLQTDARVSKWLNDLIRAQCSRNEPVTESAVGNAITILRGLNPQGNTSLLDLYVTILSQTYDPNKAEQAAKKTSEAMSAAAPRGGKMDQMPMMPMGPSPMAGRGRPSFTGSGNNKPIPAYVSIGPTIIQAIGVMTIPEAQTALTQLGRSRQDLLGMVAMTLYSKDSRQSLTLFRQLLNDSSKKPEVSSQAQMAVRFLIQTSDVASFDLLARTFAKTDSATAAEILRMLSDLNKAGKLPADFNIKQALRSMIQGLTNEVRSRREMESVLRETIKLGESLQDADVTRVIDRANKTLQALSKQPQKQYTPRSNSRRR